MKFYESLGLRPALSIDLEALKKSFYEQSRLWHPDRFSRSSAAEQQTALDKTALLNDAFRTLRDPIERAEYFLEEKGVPPSKNPPPELLEEVFELNMALEELRGGDASVRPELEAAQARMEKMLTDSDSSLNHLFLRYDASEEGIEEIRATLDRRRYISNLVRDAERALSLQASRS